jgi:hypothetical protein
MEQSAQAYATGSPAGAVTITTGGTEVTVAQRQAQYLSLNDAYLAPEVALLMKIALGPNPEEELGKHFGTVKAELPEINRVFLDHPIDEEHFPIETLPEEF